MRCTSFVRVSRVELGRGEGGLGGERKGWNWEAVDDVVKYALFWIRMGC